MTNFIFLDVTLGLVFVYLLLALMCTTVNEGIAGALKRRSKTLEEGIRGMLDGSAPTDQSFLRRLVKLAEVWLWWRRAMTSGHTKKFYDHPLVKGLAKAGKRPSYIPARTFAQVLTTLLAEPPASLGTPQEFFDKLSKLSNEPLRKSLQAILQGTDAKATLESIQGKIENWFNDAMDRVSGWYKRDSAVWVAIIAGVVTVATNADTLDIAKTLWTSPTLRAAMVERAKGRAEMPLSIEYTNAYSEDQPSAPVVMPNDAAQDPSRLTEEEREVLGQLMGWGEEFKKFNRKLAEKREGAEGQACRKESKTAAAANDQCIAEFAAGRKREESRACKCGEILKKLEDTGQDATIPGWAFTEDSKVTLTWIWGLLSRHLLGWLLTAIAVSLGAPFWFDVLKKLVSLRSAGKVPERKETRPTGQPQGATP